MTGERTLPGGAGLLGYWTPGSGGWDGDGGVDENWRKVGAGLASRLVVKSRTTDPLPTPGTLGDIYIVVAGDAINPNKIALWDGPPAAEAWVYYPPFEGLRAYVKDAAAGQKLVEYDGAAWGVVVESNFSGAKATRSSDMTITSSTNTVINWNAEEYDTDAYHDPTTNPDRLTIPTTGKYRAMFTPEFDTGTVWQLWITKNGTTFNERIAYVGGYAGGGRGASPVIFEGQLTAGDILRAMCWLSAAASLKATISFFSIQKLG